AFGLQTALCRGQGNNDDIVFAGIQATTTAELFENANDFERHTTNTNRFAEWIDAIWKELGDEIVAEQRDTGVGLTILVVHQPPGTDIPADHREVRTGHADHFSVYLARNIIRGPKHHQFRERLFDIRHVERVLKFGEVAHSQR